MTTDPATNRQRANGGHRAEAAEVRVQARYIERNAFAEAVCRE